MYFGYQILDLNTASQTHVRAFSGQLLNEPSNHAGQEASKRKDGGRTATVLSSHALRLACPHRGRGSSCIAATTDRSQRPSGRGSSWRILPGAAQRTIWAPIHWMTLGTHVLESSNSDVSRNNATCFSSPRLGKAKRKRGLEFGLRRSRSFAARVDAVYQKLGPCLDWEKFQLDE
jgi:hypothetical protein